MSFVLQKGNTAENRLDEIINKFYAFFPVLDDDGEILKRVLDAKLGAFNMMSMREYVMQDGADMKHVGHAISILKELKGAANIQYDQGLIL